jgi:outer membrane protein assembly factor BamE
MTFSFDFCVRCSAVAALAIAVSACSTFNSATGRIGSIVSPYRTDVVQGNFVSKEQKEALKVGMPRNQVRDILGSPLVTSAFHADRWEYAFTILRQGQEPQQRKLTVFFKGDELTKVDSDELISEEEFVNALSAGRRLGKVPNLEASPEQLKSASSQPAAAAQAASDANKAATPVAAPRAYPPLEPAAR